MLDEIYEQFKAVVKKGRGERLDSNDDTVFSGLHHTISIIYLFCKQKDKAWPL